MENLSSTEASLLLAIKRRPRQRLAIYGNSLKGVSYIHVLHARNRLIQLNMIVENDSGLIEVNEPAIEKINTEIMREHSDGVVHTNAVPEIPAKPLGAVTVQKFEDVDAKVLEHLRASPNGRTAAELASPFGTKGTSLNWTLRNLIKSQQVVKRDLKYYLAEECDKVTHIKVAVDTRRAVTTSLEIRTFILQQEGEFTLDQCFDKMSKIYKLDREQFAGVFTDLVLDGYFNVHDGNEYVQHDMEFCADNLHERCVNVSSEDGISELLKDYVASAKDTFTMDDVVKATGLRHDRITPKLAGWGYNTTDQDRISKRPVETVSIGYAAFECIDVSAAQSLIFGIVKIDVFMKRFNLDPKTKAQVIKNLLMLNMATYDTDSGFLGPVKKAQPVAVEDDSKRVAENNDEPTVEEKQLGTTKQNLVDILRRSPEPTRIYVGRDYEHAHVHKETHADYYGHVVFNVDRDGMAEISAEPDMPWLEIDRAKTQAPDAVTKYAESTFKVSAPEETIPTHVTRPQSPLYGHPIMDTRVIGDKRHLLVSSKQDKDWVALNPNPLDVKGVSKSIDEVIAEVTAHEKEYADTIHTAECTDLTHKVGPCGRSGGPGQTGTARSVGADMVKEKVIASDCGAYIVKASETVNPVDPRWIVTLQMMEERFYHEHQTTTAKVLSEIREFLSK